MWVSVGIVGIAVLSALTAQGIVLPIVGAVAAVAVYWAVMRYVARRAAPEIGRARAGRFALLGGVIGFGFVAVSMLAVVTEFSFTANPGATLWSSFAIAVEAGVLLGAAFLWKRSIWLVVGLHFTWNTTIGLIGIPVSGHSSSGLLITTPRRGRACSPAATSAWKPRSSPSWSA